jgi:dipeptidyl aminopeptidase/acylaminoacyl peptidase
MLRCLTLSAVGLALAGAAAAAPPPISLFGQLPAISTIELSPDGKRWVAAMGDDTSTQIQVRSVADGKLLSFTPVEKAKLRDVTWLSNDHIVSTMSTTTAVAGLEGPRREWYQLGLLDLRRDSSWRPLLDGIPDTLNAALGTPLPFLRDGHQYVSVPVMHFKSNLGVLALAEVRLGRPSGRIVAVGTVDTMRFFVGNDGEPLAREDYAERSKEWRLMLKSDGVFRRVYSEIAPIDRPFLSSFGRDDGTLVLTSHKSGEWADYEVKLADLSVGDSTMDYSGDRVLVDRRSRTAFGTMTTRLDGVDYRFFNPRDAGLWRALTKAFPGEQVRLESWSEDRQTIIVEVQGAKNGVSLFMIDRAKGKAELLTERYSNLQAEHISPVTSFTYKAADGLEIPAYLTLPKGREAKGLPLIVLAHGGPASRDDPSFDWWAQALASRGYAVLQPQFRGSTGFGEAHRAAGFGQWGRKMQTDLSDGVRDLVAKGTVDAKRVCIAGASYGGYAAMAGVTLDTGVYRCASAVAGVSDLRRMLVTEISDSGSERNATMRYWQRFMGAQDTGDTSIDAWSPARLAARVAVPLQLIHGKDDTVVRIEQSRMMRDAMAKAGKPVDYLELAGEDHWLSRPATRVAMLEAQVAFLERHNPPN